MATASARAELMHAVAIRERAGEPPPCRLAPEPFTSDQAAERRRAAELCARCPLAALCRDYAAEAGEVWGVWGGVDRSKVTEGQQ
ncbi:MAG: WhiB family transcriptional regulator [Brachybacterium sp.]|uniref:WhiB family transcriptional regulator n=1 Tax=Brachybacterium sp. TaxID=1891286 RepID=UPI003F92A949